MCDSLAVLFLQVMSLAEAAQESQAGLEEALVRLRSCNHLLVALLSLWHNLNQEQSSILEASLLPLLHDSPQLVRTLTLTHSHSQAMKVSVLLSFCPSVCPQPAQQTHHQLKHTLIRTKDLWSLRKTHTHTQCVNTHLSAQCCVVCVCFLW